MAAVTAAGQTIAMWHRRDTGHRAVGDGLRPVVSYRRCQVSRCGDGCPGRPDGAECWIDVDGADGRSKGALMAQAAG